MGQDDIAAAEADQRKGYQKSVHKRAALERDLKYYAVQYFVGDCVLDRALLPYPNLGCLFQLQELPIPMKLSKQTDLHKNAVICVL